MTNDEKSHMTQDDTKSAEKNTSDKKTKDGNEQSDVEHRNPNKPETFPFKLTSREKLAKKHPDKFEIVKKMFYAWDNLETIQGEFKWGWGGEFRQSWFNVNFLKEMNRSKHQVHSGGEVVWKEEFLMRDGIATSYNPERNVYYQEDS